jgi:hypothetical protein
MPDTSESNATLLPSGVVKFPPNVHGIYVEPQASGYVRIVARQNEQELAFVLDAAACRHLASLLLGDRPEP